jgi:1-acyl-sn-glycerol-3-phosphate acyltransferase
MTTDRPAATPDPALPDNASPFIRLTDLVGRTIVRGLTRVRVEGIDNARGLTGPVIVASNHVSNADGVLVASWITPAIGRRIYLLGKQEALEWPLIGLGLRYNAVLGIRRGAADLEAFRAAKRILDEGHVLGIFPEGTRSPNGALQEAKDGLAILALRTRATILPVGVANTDRFWPRGKSPQFGGWVGLRVGKPFRLDEITRDLPRREAQAAATNEIMGRIAGLLPPRHRGAYSDRVVEQDPEWAHE